VLSRGEDVTSAVRLSERRTAFLVVIRRVVLLASFLLTGFVIAACWSATASAAENGADEAPRPVHDRLVAMVAKNATAEADAVDSVHELVDVAEAVDQADEVPELSRVIMDVLDAMGPNSVDDVVDMVHETPGDLVTMIDTAADRGIASEAPSASRRQAGPDHTVVERGWSSPEVAPSTVVTSSRGFDTVVPTVSSPSVAPDATAPVDQDLSSQFPNGFPVAPFSAAGTGGGSSAVGSSCGTVAGAIASGATCHDDVFVVSGIAAESVHPVRQLALVPQVSPA
jgi:hypothetical protein